MKLAENVTGIQHLGLPTKDMAKTLQFYKALGFTVAFHTVNSGDEVNFLQLKNVVIETYESTDVKGTPGAIDHIALDVVDVEQAFAAAKANGFQMLDAAIQYLPFWKNGVKFFTIMGPNAEKIEFSQML